MSQTKAQLISDLVQSLNFSGTSAAPANGMYLSAANTIKLSTNTTPRLTIDSSGNAVFTGTCTATTFIGALTGTASGNAVLTGSTNNTIATVTGTNAIQGEANLTFDGTSLKIANTFSAHSEGDDLVIGGAGWRGMTIYGEGGGGVIQFADDADNRVGQIMYQHSNNSMIFRVSGNQTRMLIDSSGRVLIGATSTSPANSYSDNLIVSEASGNAGISIHGNNSNSNYASLYFGDAGAASRAYFEATLGSNGNFTIGSDTGTGTIRFVNGGAERLRIDSTGKVGIGDTSPTKVLTIGTTTPVILLDDQSSRTLELVGPSATTNAELRTTSSHNLYFGVSTVTTTEIAGTGQIRIKRSNNNTVDIVALKGAHWGYSTGGYAGVRIGNPNVATNSTIFMGVDVEANGNGGFAGNGSEVVWRNNHSFVIPNAANNGYLTPMTLNSGAATEGVPRFKQGLLFKTDTADANILDDYEEGTHAFSLQGGGSNPSSESFDANYRNMHYVKIGNLVTVWGELRWAFTSGGFGSGEFRITLPFTSASISGPNNITKGCVQFWNVNWKYGQTSADSIHSEVSDNKAYMVCRRSQSNSTYENLLNLGTSTFQTSNSGLGTEMNFSITYRAA